MPHTLQRHIVLVAPEIHWNTGNIGRTCLGAGACLHLIRPLGFSLESSQVKRAGLDYWDQVRLSVWEDFADFESAMAPAADELAVFTKSGRRALWELPQTAPRLFLVFGAETAGLPHELMARFNPAQTYYIPISGRIRSLNLSTAAGIALYESLRTGPDFHAWPGSLSNF